MRTIAHVSDLHFGRIDPAASAALGAALRSLKPDLVIVSGDLTQRARSEQFREAAEFLAGLATPVLAVPGNHDVPLWHALARFLWPYHGYRRHIAVELEPVHEDAELLVLGLNSARSLAFYGGRLNSEQVGRAVERLRHAGRERLKIVVSHHPLSAPLSAGPEAEAVGRGARMYRRLVDAGGEVFLAGHFHHTAHELAEPLATSRRRALLVHAGTATSTRRRASEGNGFNLLRYAGGHLSVVHYEHRSQRSTDFVPVTSRDYHRGDYGWEPLAH